MHAYRPDRRRQFDSVRPLQSLGEPMEEKKETQELNVKQLKFIDGILEGKTQQDAYIDAGYDVEDKGVASAAATRLLKNVKIKEELEERLKEINTRNRVRLFRISEVALAKALNMIQSTEEISDASVKAGMIKDVLDRVGLKAIEEHNLNIKGKIETGLSKKEEDEIIKLAFRAVKGDMPPKDKGENKE